MPRVGVQCLVRELGSDRLWGQKTNPLDRSSSVTNSVKTLKKKILLCDVLTPAWMSWIIRWNEVAYLEESAQCRVCNKYSVNASCDYCLYYYYCYYYYSPFHRWVKHVCLKCTFTHIILSRKVMDGKKKKKSMMEKETGVWTILWVFTSLLLFHLLFEMFTLDFTFPTEPFCLWLCCSGSYGQNWIASKSLSSPHEVSMSPQS